MLLQRPKRRERKWPGLILEGESKMIYKEQILVIGKNEQDWTSREQDLKLAVLEGA